MYSVVPIGTAIAKSVRFDWLHTYCTGPTMGQCFQFEAFKVLRRFRFSSDLLLSFVPRKSEGGTKPRTIRLFPPEELPRLQAILPRDCNPFCLHTLYHVFAKSLRFDWLHSAHHGHRVSNEAFKALERCLRCCCFLGFCPVTR